MSGYTKLFSTITDSTIWQESDATRLVWITMLAMADQEGYVGASIPGLAARARVSLPDCIDALRVLMSPDPYSRTPDFEGRRIAEDEGGWTLLNHAKYRQIRNQDERRERSRLAMAKLRAERKLLSDVSDVSLGLPKQKEEASSEAKQKQDQELPADKPPKRTRRQQAMDYPLPLWADRQLWARWIEKRKTPDAGLDLNLQKLDQWRAQGYDPNAILLEAAAAGWQGLFLPSSIKTQGAIHDHPTNPFERRRGEGSAEWSARINRLHDERERAAAGGVHATAVGADGRPVPALMGQCVGSEPAE